mgnify:FL=1
MVFDKPVINLIFGNEENGLYNDQRFLGYAHIEHLVNSKASKVVKNKTELINTISDYFIKDEDAINRKNFIEQQVGVSLKETNSILADSMKQWV